MVLNLNSNFKPKFEKPAGKSINGYERIYIDHQSGKFNSSLGPDSEFLAAARKGRDIEVVMLGLIRTRQMWPKRDDNPSRADGQKIASGGKQCISLDGEIGHPQANFPVKTDAETLKCSTCPFTSWSSDGKTGPACQPRWYIPLTSPASSDEEPVILDLTQSGITKFKDYVKNSSGIRNPLFKRRTVISLDVVKKNSIQFVRPEFEPSAKTSPYMEPLYVYWLRRLSLELTDISNLNRMGGKSTPSKFTSLMPSK